MAHDTLLRKEWGDLVIGRRRLRVRYLCG